MPCMPKKIKTPKLLCEPQKPIYGHIISIYILLLTMNSIQHTLAELEDAMATALLHYEEQERVETCVVHALEALTASFHRHVGEWLMLGEEAMGVSPAFCSFLPLQKATIAVFCSCILKRACPLNGLWTARTQLCSAWSPRCCPNKM